MMALPLPAWAQTSIPNPPNGADGPIGDTTIPANVTTFVGTDPGFTQNFTNSLSGSTITIVDPSTSFLVKAGSGTFTIDGGTIAGPGQFIAVGGVVAQTSGTTNANSFLAVGSGAANPPGALAISGGTILFGQTALGTALHVGDFGGTGTVNQIGGAVVIGGHDIPVSLNIGNQGGTGVYNLSGGTLSFNGTGTTSFVVLGRNTGATAPSTGTLNLSGTGSMTLTNAELIIGSNGGSNPGSGIIN
jgi:uncharacterized Zn-binding protein involved in type VI secretion